jgi:hypothetical protein
MMSKKQWIRRIASIVLIGTLVIAVWASAGAATRAYVQPTAAAQVESDSGLTTIFGASARSLQLLR